MDEQKICFIICWNSEFYLKECKLYLDELERPDGYEVEIVEISGAQSMTSGYNEGMKRTNAKYKVYMHQDVFLTNKHFLVDMLELFQQDGQIGMIGLVGTPYMYRTGTMWEGIRFGGFYRLEESIKKGNIRRFFPLKTGYMEMEAVDGLLIATQYDLPWREDLLRGWDFYDVSQGFEFRRVGYKVVVPGQSLNWYIHDCGAVNLSHYDEACEIFLKAYAAEMKEREQETKISYVQQVRKRIEKGFHGTEQERERLYHSINRFVNNE